jgi:hypothetical protein
MTRTYSNPRKEAVIENWPIGAKRTTATFNIGYVNGRGERASRYTIDPKTGKPSAPKLLTYAKQARIVDGDDGKTYIINLTEFGHISVFQGNMQYNEEAIFPTDARYAEVLALFAA